MAGKYGPGWAWAIPITIPLLLLIVAGLRQTHDRFYEVQPLTTNRVVNQNPSVVPATGPLFVNPDNPRYFTDGKLMDGKFRSVYLTGSHTWCNFTDCGYSSPPEVFDYSGYLDFLEANNHNFFRMWRAETAMGGEISNDFWFEPMPYKRSSICCANDGGNKFDLSEFEQAYFDRMRIRILQAGERGIYVSIMLFDGWSIEDKRPDHHPWIGHPYNSVNNINHVDGDTNHNDQGEETHILLGTDVTALQEAYIRKVIDTVNDLDNVLYEVSNESPGDDPNSQTFDGSRDWQYHMISVIKSYEAGKPQQHPVGMTWEWENGNNRNLYDSSADWISPNESLTNPTIAGGWKVILSDTDHHCGICGTRDWVWRSFTSGQNPIFMDSYDPDFTGRGAFPDYEPDNPNDVSLRINMGYSRAYANRMNLTNVLPMPDLCSTGFCLANPSMPGAEFLIYLPSGGSATVNLSLISGPLNYEWFNLENGTVAGFGPVMGGATRSFTAPFSGDAVLYIDAQLPATSTPITGPTFPSLTSTVQNSAATVAIPSAMASTELTMTATPITSEQRSGRILPNWLFGALLLAVIIGVLFHLWNLRRPNRSG